MATKNTATSWGWPARLFHWAMAVVILFLLGIGFYMANFEEDIYAQFGLTQTHKSWGFVAFCLVILRLIWRAFNRAPELPEAMTALERFGAHAAHVVLYACMFVMPLSGWLMASASPLSDQYGIKNQVFGLFELPDPFVPGSMELEEVFGTIHFVAALILVAILAAHILAALKHAIINRDGVLRRMITG